MAHPNDNAVIDFHEGIDLLTSQNLIPVFLVIIGLLLALALAVRYFGDKGGGKMVSDMIGLQGKALSNISEKGKVYVRGEIWDAVAIGDLVSENDPIEVIGFREGLVLEIKKISLN